MGIVLHSRLSVRFGNTLQLVLLLDGIAVAGSLSSVDQLISQALGDRLDVTESCFPCSSAEQPDSLVHASQGGNINSLSSDCSLSTNTGRILTRSGVDDSINQNLKRILASSEIDDLKAVFDNTNSHKFLAVVTSMHHQTVDQTLNDRTLSLLKPF